MTEYASFDDLIAGSLEDDAEDVTLPTGKVVRMRGLTRHELLFNGKGADDNPLLLERRNVMSCLVQPKLTIAQVEQWQKRDRANGDFRALSEAIRRLSGLDEGADKSSVRDVRDES